MVDGRRSEQSTGASGKSSRTALVFQSHSPTNSVLAPNPVSSCLPALPAAQDIPWLNLDAEHSELSQLQGVSTGVSSSGVSGA